MAMDYFAPAAAAPGDASKSVLVDMSCATGKCVYVELYCVECNGINNCGAIVL